MSVDVSSTTKLLSQAANPSKTLGKEIVSNQPDVEVLAVAFRPVPTTVDKFDEMRDKKDFVVLQFGIVDIGPPGFSSAPYKSTKKKTDGPVPTKPLYERREEYKYPLFFPFEKGPTPKDRGPRIESDESGLLAACLEPGVSITHFLYNENDRFAADKFIVGACEGDVVPQHAFVFLQLSCNNIDQARKGRLLKIKKIKPAVSFDLYKNYLLSASANLPASAETAMAVLDTAGQKFPSIKEMLGQGSSAAVFATQPHVYASANCSDDESGIEIPEYAGEGCRPLFVPKEVACAGCHTHTLERASKIMSIAIATEALRVVARPASVQKGPEAPDEALAVVIDHDKMFGFSTLARALNSGDVTCARLTSSIVQWFVPCATVETDTGTKQLAFELGLEKRQGKSAGKNAGQPGVVSDGCAGEYYPLRVIVCPAGQDFAFPDSLADGVCTLNLQFRPANAVGGKKRKRVNFEADDDSDDEESDS